MFKVLINNIKRRATGDIPIQFGTDGWRGIIAEDFTFDNVRLCAQATASVITQQPELNPVVVIGYDTRFASRDFAKTTAEVLAANGIKCLLSSSISPTPLISHATVANNAVAGVVITASHNPSGWNGFKIKSRDGSSAQSEFILNVENNIAAHYEQGSVNSIEFDEGINKGLIELGDFKPGYLAQLQNLVDICEIGKTEEKICFDAMFGAGAGYLNEIFHGSNIGVIEINSQPNPMFPGIKQPEPIEQNLLQLSRLVPEIGAGVGLATDGDADRLGVVDERGNFLTALQVYSLLALYFLEIRGETGPIVRTITSSAMLDRLGEIYNVPVYEVPVGFKHVAPVMIKENALIGGEESGGYGFRGHVPERDGLLSALFFFDYMVKTGKKPSELLKHLYKTVGPHHYDRVDLTFPPLDRDLVITRVKRACPATINNLKVVKKDDLDGFRFKFDDGSWLLIRFSGTEPLLRLYSEASSPEKVSNLLKAGKDITGIGGG